MKKNNAFRRAAALIAALSITGVSGGSGLADTYYIDYGDITITKNEDGQPDHRTGGGDKWTDKAGRRPSSPPLIRSSPRWRATLEGPAAEDSDFGPG